MSAVIVGAARTPMGGLMGELAGLTAPQLGAAAIRGALDRAGRPGPSAVLMGCVLPAGQGQAPARQAGFGAGLAEDVPAVTLNKMCGSGMQALAQAADLVELGRADCVVAGGMESMSAAPYLLPKMRGGARLGHGQVIDSMFLDGLEDAYEGRLMGTYAEDCAQRYQLTRDAQDAYALASLDRARAGAADEIVPVAVPGRTGETVVAVDEQPRTARPEKIPTLRPAFREGGTVTPANSSSISDGAAALVVMSAAAAQAGGHPVLARIAGWAGHAQAPGWFATAPIPAARSLLDRLGWAPDSVEVWEVNEAFAVVPMAFMAETGIGHDRLNLRGGACALGHPIGASGARIVVTLLHIMAERRARRGLAAICIGGGEGLAVAVETL